MDTAHSVISGGNLNVINTLSQYSFISGGLSNSIASSYSAINGGQDHTISRAHSAISGGRSNTVDSGFSVICGGDQNIINNSSGYSFVGGGVSNNIASSTSHSVIIGGRNNTTSTGYQILGGHSAKTSPVQANAAGTVLFAIGGPSGSGNILTVINDGSTIKLFVGNNLLGSGSGLLA